MRPKSRTTAHTHLWYVAECVEQGHDVVLFASQYKSRAETQLARLEEKHKWHISRKHVGFKMDSLQLVENNYAPREGAYAYFITGMTEDRDEFNPFLHIGLSERKAKRAKIRLEQRLERAQILYDDNNFADYDEEDLYYESFRLDRVPLNVLSPDIDEGWLEIFEE